MDIRKAFPNWDEPDPEKIRIQAEKRKIAEKKRQEFIKNNNLIELKSDYYSTMSYYWNKEKRIMVKLDHLDINFNYEITNDEHIKKLNNL